MTNALTCCSIWSLPCLVILARRSTVSKHILYIDGTDTSLQYLLLSRLFLATTYLHISWNRMYGSKWVFKCGIESLLSSIGFYLNRFDRGALLFDKPTDSESSRLLKILALFGDFELTDASLYSLTDTLLLEPSLDNLLSSRFTLSDSSLPAFSSLFFAFSWALDCDWGPFSDPLWLLNRTSPLSLSDPSM